MGKLHLSLAPRNLVNRLVSSADPQWRLVDAHAVYDFHDHRDLLSSLGGGAVVRSLTDREIFDTEKQKTDPPLDSKIFQNRNAHLCGHGANYTAGNGSIEGMGVAYPPFMALSEEVSTFTSGLPQISATLL